MLVAISSEYGQLAEQSLGDAIMTTYDHKKYPFLQDKTGKKVFHIKLMHEKYIEVVKFRKVV